MNVVEDLLSVMTAVWDSLDASTGVAALTWQQVLVGMMLLRVLVWFWARAVVKE